MFHTKLEVDRHVENCLKKINSDEERNIRCFAFAKLYYKVGDYEQARRYVTTYLNVRPQSADGQNMLGNSLEKLGKREAALEAYKSSLRLDPKQNNLVIKVCQMLASEDMNLDQSTARYFCEKAQKFDPHNPAIFQLKERLVATETNDPNEVSQLLLKELETRPTDVDIRVRLLRHLLQNKQIKEAYQHAFNIEQKHLSMFLNSLSWYETLAEVLIRYQLQNSVNNLSWEYWILLISVLDKLVALSLDERTVNIKNSTECVAAVFNFDQNLKIAIEHIKQCPEKQLLNEFITHYRGQLCFHFATLLFKQARKDLIKFKEAAQLSLPLLFSAFNTQPADLHAIWLGHSTELNRQQVQRWHREASFRCSQTGHMLKAAAKDRKSTIIEKAIQLSTGLWREALYKKLFVTRDYQAKIKSSHFATCSELIDISIRLPEASELIKFDEVAQMVHPNSLHHQIWIGINNKLPDFKCTVFEGLQYSVKNLNNCAAETLNILDIQAFIYCAVSCAKSQVDDNRTSMYYNNADRPNILPVAVTEQLGTSNQAKWLKCAYKMYRNQYGSELSDIRMTLIKGIEVVRCVGNHGLDVKLLVILAKTFADRSKLFTKQSEIEFNDARAELYWKAALPLLEKLINHQSISYASNRLFEFKVKEINLNEIIRFAEDGKLFTAIQFMKKKENEKALNLFETLKDPYASFYQAQLYKLMADKDTNQNKENLTSEMRSQHIILLTRARDCFYLTLDRLRDPGVDRKHPLNEKLGCEIEKIERLLTRIDPDNCINRNECDGMSDENLSSIESMGDNYNINTSYQPNYSMNGIFAQRNESHHNIQSTPLRIENSRREARPSPERLDAQLRQLAASKDATINHIIEQNRVMVESHKTLVDELRGFREAVSGLSSTVNDLKTIKHTMDDLKGIKQSVDDLKVAVEELQSFRNVTDIVHEMRKEIADLKKDNSKIKSNQLNEEDLYALEDEYGVDYANMNANVPGLAPNLYPNLGRIPPVVANSLAYAPPALYPGLYPHLYPPYGNMGLAPQSTGLPFGDAQLADFRALSQGLSQATAQAAYQQTGLTPVYPPPQQLPFAQLQQAQQQPMLSMNTNTPPTYQSNISIPSFQTSTPTNNKPPPINVVITASDPLPSINTTSQTPQILSVTIPPQHLKSNQNKLHNYQIPLPANHTMQTLPIMNQSPLPVTTQSLLSNIAPPIYSAIGDKTPNRGGLGFQIEKSLVQSFNTSDIKNISSTSDDYEACADFKPIIPLPDEVPINTGEELEDVLFCDRAKLFRFTNNEWKERGVGDLKLLKNPETLKIRLLMRREQIHKICANHYLTKDMNLIQMKNNDRSWAWAANDFADNQMILEKLCVRFKTPEQANKFFDAFEKAKSNLSDCDTPIKAHLEKPKKIEAPKIETPKASLGGFSFSTTPTFKPKDNPAIEITPKVVSVEAPKNTSPFASFTFGKTPTSSKIDGDKAIASEAKPTFSFGKPLASPSINLFASPAANLFAPVQKPQLEPIVDVADDTNAEEFVPTAEFTPVVPLPALVDTKTGEENAEIIFESKAKLLRFDKNLKEWKERGVGQMKLLKDQIIRLVMRREQVYKVCCNHQLLKTIEFSKMKKNLTCVSWCAQDFSEGVITQEMFSVRFKTEEIANTFLDIIKNAQASLDENNSVIGSTIENKSIAATPISGFGDKFKPKSGSWECKNCYIMNDTKNDNCLACETPNPAKSGTTDPISTQNATPSNTTKTKGIDLGTGGLTFNFGMPSTPTAPQAQHVFGVKKDATPVFGSFKPSTPTFGVQPIKTLFGATPEVAPNAVGFGDKFKPKVGSWECKECYTRNESDYCLSCENPRDSSVAPKQKGPTKGVDLSTGGLQFNFGMPVAAPVSSFSFSSTPVTVVAENKFSFNFSTENKPPSSDEIVFGSPHKPGFEFTPRSPRRQSGGQAPDDESENSYYEEEEDTIYFKPVIPLPDKVDVTTGEEQEEVLYCHRAKLFRYVQSEWKERGVGDLKILFKSATKKLRVLMRREQIHKICLNHALTIDVKYSVKDDKTWMFHAADFSEGEIERNQFCLRFKTAEVANEFKKAVDTAIMNITDDDTGDVEFVSETRVSREEEEEALKLGLPPKFFAYRQLPDCKCAQCKKEDLMAMQPAPPSKGTPPINQSIFGTTIFGTPNTTMFGTPNTSSIFATPTNDPYSFSTSVDISKKEEESVKPPIIEKIPTPFSFKSIVIDSAKTPTSSGTPLFGGATSFPTTPVPNKLFGSSTQPIAASSMIFGATSISVSSTPTNTTGSLFGTPSVFASSSTSIFNNAATTGSLFGTPTPSTTGSIFGGSSVSSAATTGSLFGTPPVFGESGNVFGGKATSFGANDASNNVGTFAAVAESTLPELKEDDALVLNTKSTISFASLAAGTGDKQAFAKSGDGDKNPFAYLGAGAPVFGGGAKVASKSGDASQDLEESVNHDDEYDPQYEPIVPLPDAIVVKTGEEDEEVMFNERAKLYRYDNKEWKERGVGQLKVLHHPIQNTYRLILRREQVHKLVLNQLIKSEFNIKPMNISVNAWCWFGHNFCDDVLNMEELAVRFKKEETSNLFNQVIQQCIADLKENHQNTSIPSTVQHFVENVSEDEEHDEEDDEGDDDDYNDDEEEDDRVILFSKECTMWSLSPITGQWTKIADGAEMQIFFDSELYGSKIRICDGTGLIISNSIIGRNTIIDMDGTNCRWTSVEWADDLFQLRTVKVTFASAEDSQQCILAYQESLGYAEQFDIVDGIPPGLKEETEE